MVKEKDLNDKFFSVFKKLINDESYSNELSKAIKLLAKPKATIKIIEQIKSFFNLDFICSIKIIEQIKSRLKNENKL